MNVILTMKIQNGGSTVRMNSAETYIKDAQALTIMPGTSGLIHSNTVFHTKKIDYLEMKVLRHHVFLS